MSQFVNNAATQAVESGIFASERTKQETTGPSQTTPAGSGDVKREAEVKVSDVQTAASDAAETAQTKFPETAGQTASTSDVLQNRLSEKTDAAAAEGQKDVEAAKVTGNSYVEQAKLVGGSVLATAQGYVEAGQNRLSPQNQDGSTQSGGVVPTLMNAANTALGATKTLLTSAQETLQPHVDNAKATAQPHIDNARAAAQPHIDNAKAAAQPHIDAAVNAATPYVQSATETARPYVQSAKEAVAPSQEKTNVDTIA